MIQSKYINGIIAFAVVLALVFSILLLGFTDSRAVGAGTVQPYQKAVFGADIISVDIIADEDDWNNMLKNATSEQYIMVDVVVNGTKFQSVGIRPKGNSSLTQVAQSDSSRFSFRLKFDEYIEGQTCFGLDTFVLNNMLGDNSYMKEYLSYELFSYIGVDAPLHDFANITVNGQKWGLYLAIEAYNDSYQSRVYGNSAGNLYNVKSMDMGNRDDNQADGQNGAQAPGNGQVPGNGQMPEFPGNGQAPDMSGNNQAPDLQDNGQTPATNPNGQTRQGGQRPDNQGNFKGGMGGRGSSGGDLKYTDDKISSYSSIFNNAIGKVTETDEQRVIAALKNLSSGMDLETYFNVDKILRYMAAHTVVVNLDSYSSNMAQNYYIYEKDGQITILPWDYNYSFGGFQSGSASDVVNFPIDTPVSGVTLEDRPLFEKLLANETYKAKYHEYLNEIITGYFANGKWSAKIAELNALISGYVKTDPTAFCTFEEYQKAVPALTTLGELRAESIKGQLDGTVPSTGEAQTANPDKLISADFLNLSDLGGGGGGKMGGFNQNGANSQMGGRFGGKR